MSLYVVPVCVEDRSGNSNKRQESPVFTSCLFSQKYLRLDSSAGVKRSGKFIETCGTEFWEAFLQVDSGP